MEFNRYISQNTPQMRNTFLAIGTVLGWLAVGLQFYLIIVNRIASVTETIIRFFSFFTILTNTLVALCFTMLLLKPESVLGKFFSRSKILAAITVYIVIVGIVYNVILRSIWNPEGLQLVADELLHSVMPVWFILFWLLFAPKAELQWGNVFPWLIYPFVYTLFIFFRGALSGFYPYPFIDANALGYGKVLFNSIILFFAFLLLSLVLVAIGKIISKTGIK